MIEEISHLRRQAANPGAGTDDEGVVVDEIFDLGDRGGLVKFVIRFARDLFRDELWHALDINLRAGLTCPLGNCVRHRLDMAV